MTQPVDAGGPARLRGAERMPSVRRSVVLETSVRLVFHTVLVFGVYLLFAGHNQPGGGFIAGLVVAIALLMQSMASGYEWAAQRRRVEAHTMLGLGVLIAGLTGAGALAFGRPFLTSAFGYFHLPVVGEFELASAIAFDLGVSLAVVGTVLLSLSQISRVQGRAERKPVPAGPADIRLPRPEQAAVEPAAQGGD